MLREGLEHHNGISSRFWRPSTCWLCSKSLSHPAPYQSYSLSVLLSLRPERGIFRVFFDFFGYFRGLFCRPPKRLFSRLFWDFGPEGPGDSCKWALGSQSSHSKALAETRSFPSSDAQLALAMHCNPPRKGHEALGRRMARRTHWVCGWSRQTPYTSAHVYTRFVRGLLGTGPPDPTLESASLSPPQGSIWHRFNIDSTSIS